MSSRGSSPVDSTVPRGSSTVPRGSSTVDSTIPRGSSPVPCVDSERPPSPLSPRTQTMLANKDAYIAQLRAFLNKGRYKFAAIFGGIAAEDEDLVRVCLS